MRVNLVMAAHQTLAVRSVHVLQRQSRKNIAAVILLAAAASAVSSAIWITYYKSPATVGRACGLRDDG